jgi:hypothetical protein
MSAGQCYRYVDETIYPDGDHMALAKHPDRKPEGIWWH